MELFLRLSLGSTTSGNNANKVVYSKQSLFHFCIFALVYFNLCAARGKEIQTSHYHTAVRAMSFVADFLQEVNDIASHYLVLHKHLSQALLGLEGLLTAMPNFGSNRDPSSISV